MTTSAHRASIKSAQDERLSEILSTVGIEHDDKDLIGSILKAKSSLVGDDNMKILSALTSSEDPS